MFPTSEKDKYADYNVDCIVDQLLAAERAEEELESDEKLHKLVIARLKKKREEKAGEVSSLKDLSKKYSKMTYKDPDDKVDPEEKAKEDVGKSAHQNKLKMEDARFEKE